jgi:hypothetical protein
MWMKRPTDPTVEICASMDGMDEQTHEWDGCLLKTLKRIRFIYVMSEIQQTTIGTKRIIYGP